MTVNSAQQVLFEYFLTEDLFNLSDVRKVFLSFNEKVDKEIVKISLRGMEELGLVKYFSLDDEEYWILVKPLQCYEQNVTLSAITASTLSRVINKHCEEYNDDSNICNPISIVDRDIQNILKLIIEEKNEQSLED